MTSPEAMDRPSHEQEMKNPSKFIESLEARWDEGLYVCVGLDPDIDEYGKLFDLSKFVDQNNRLGMTYFLSDRIMEVIDVTQDLAAVFKPNAAFYEQLEGDTGNEVLSLVMDKLSETDVPNILDVKRGDIGNTQKAYAKSAFENFNATAATVNPYMSDDAVLPFASYEDKGTFVLVRTSNPSASKTQDRIMQDGRRYWELMAELSVNDWNKNGNIGIVMGATTGEQLLKAREIVGSEIPILAPGVGKQGGSVKDVVAAGNRRFVINASRSLLYPDLETGEDYKDGVRRVFLQLHKEIQTELKAV